MTARRRPAWETGALKNHDGCDATVGEKAASDSVSAPGLYSSAISSAATCMEMSLGRLLVPEPADVPHRWLHRLGERMRAGERCGACRQRLLGKSLPVRAELGDGNWAPSVDRATINLSSASPGWAAKQDDLGRLAYPAAGA
jgi:hypothetical protein